MILVTEQGGPEKVEMRETSHQACSNSLVRTDKGPGGQVQRNHYEKGQWKGHGN